MRERTAGGQRGTERRLEGCARTVAATSELGRAPCRMVTFRLRDVRCSGLRGEQESVINVRRENRIEHC